MWLDAARESGMNVGDIEDSYKLSPLQQGLLFRLSATATPTCI